MDPRSVAALIVYLDRAWSIVPATGAEIDAIRNCLPMLEGVARGSVKVTLTPVDDEKPAASETKPSATT